MSAYIREETACDDEEEVATAAHLLLLHFSGHHQQLRRGMLYFKVSQDRGGVICNGALSPGIHDQLAQPVRA